MNQDEFISVKDFCHYHSIEITFIRSLEDSGLIQVSTIEEHEFIPYDEIPRIEKFIRMHYDLDINVEGLETIDYLLQKVESLQKELNHIRLQIQNSDSSEA
jgi:hypothetical protein